MVVSVDRSVSVCVGRIHKRQLADLQLFLSLLGDASELAHEALAPPCTGVLVDVFGELVVVDSTLLVTHGDRVVDGISKLLSVPRVDDQRSVKALRGAGELGENHHTVALLLASNVLV